MSVVVLFKWLDGFKFNFSCNLTSSPKMGSRSLVLPWGSFWYISWKRESNKIKVMLTYLVSPLPTFGIEKHFDFHDICIEFHKVLKAYVFQNFHYFFKTFKWPSQGNFYEDFYNFYQLPETNGLSHWCCPITLFITVSCPLIRSMILWNVTKWPIFPQTHFTPHDPNG